MKVEYNIWKLRFFTTRNCYINLKRLFCTRKSLKSIVKVVSFHGNRRVVCTDHEGTMSCSGCNRVLGKQKHFKLEEERGPFGWKEGERRLQKDHERP